MGTRRTQGVGATRSEVFHEVIQVILQSLAILVDHFVDHFMQVILKSLALPGDHFVSGIEKALLEALP